LFSAGVNVATGGNHSFKKDEVVTLLGDPSVPLLRPANFPDTVPGSGARVVEVGTRKILVLNINGRVFMHEGVDDPFASLDSILRQHDQEQYAATIVDFHGEATSEKVAFGWYADGRVSAVVGTHTHVPTADEWILPNGTAYVTDAGMCGGRDTVIGITKDHALRGFRSPLPGKFEPPDEGVARFNSVLIEVDPKTRKALNIERIDRELEV
jgi:metallophosphoesterase (TIGR00282 family)